MQIPREYRGRLFTRDQLSNEECEQAIALPSQTQQGTCFRCATPFETEAILPNGAYYCRACILLGRVRTDQNLYTFSPVIFEEQVSLKWQGQLTDWQNQVSAALCQQVAIRQSTLVHAVTGAGKTEMIYQAIASVLDKGGSVCLASPRIDVCLELYQRLSRDFACPIALLHGESEGYFATPLVVSTTHQLLKFYQAFDLIIIDEVDAFPYVDNPMLYHAVEQAKKPDGVLVFLTATSTKALNQQVAKGQLTRLSLPRRFHGNPLVVPQFIWDDTFFKALSRRTVSTVLRQYIEKQRQTGFPLLIFAPEIALGKEFASILQSTYPDERVGFVSSQTENRLEIVEQFCQKELTILVSTTILERGVTFPCVDVFVLESHHRLYSHSSLIQIGGRVGRSMDRPTGQLLFFHAGKTAAMVEAVQEIQRMNKEAGYD